MYCVIATGCNAAGSIAFITISMTFNGAATVTNFINPHDLAPNYAGSIYGLINTIGSISGFLTPMVTGYVTMHNVSFSENTKRIRTKRIAISERTQKVNLIT